MSTAFLVGLLLTWTKRKIQWIGDLNLDTFAHLYDVYLNWMWICSIYVQRYIQLGSIYDFNVYLLLQHTVVSQQVTSTLSSTHYLCCMLYKTACDLRKKIHTFNRGISEFCLHYFIHKLQIFSTPVVSYPRFKYPNMHIVLPPLNNQLKACVCSVVSIDNCEIKRCIYEDKHSQSTGLTGELANWPSATVLPPVTWHLKVGSWT